MSLSQGLWSDYTVIIYSMVAVLFTVVWVVVFQYRSTQRLRPRDSLVLPIVVSVGELLFLKFTGQQVWFWLLVGTAFSVGASGALGTAVRNRQRASSAVSFALMVVGVLFAGFLSQVPLQWTVILVGVMSAVGFVIGYVVPTVSQRSPERSASAT